MYIVVRRLGRVGYDEALQLQEELAFARRQDLIPDQLLLLEHNPVITLGSRAKSQHVLVSQETLDRKGIIVRSATRGGDVAYHGPGQLVGYLILKLPPEARLRRLVWNIEQCLILLLAGYGVATVRRAGYPGLWLGEDKIAAIGLAVRDRVTMHGFALNISPSMEHFALINQCGLGKGVTSLSQSGVIIDDWNELEDRLAAVWKRVAEEFPLTEINDIITGG